MNYRSESTMREIYALWVVNRHARTQLALPIHLYNNITTRPE